MVLWGMTYEVPSYLPLPPFSARSPFYSPRLCSAHPSVLLPFPLHQVLPSQFPSSVHSLHPSPSFPPADLLPFIISPPVFSPFSIFSQQLFAHVHIYHFSVYCTSTFLLLPIYFSRFSHSFSPISLPYTLSSTHVKNPLILVVCSK